MLNAEDVRAITKRAQARDAFAVDTWLRCWEHLITRAAEIGRCSARESEIDRPRMIILPPARKRAEDLLREAGFTVQVVNTGPNESEVEVSW